MITLYDSPRSGHCQRVRMLLSFLGLDYRSVDVQGAERKADWFLALNPFGEVPTLDDGGVVVHDSVAILVYLARRYDPGGTWLPGDPEGAARVQRWLSVAAGELYYGIALPRAAKQWGRDVDVERGRRTGNRLLAILDDHLLHRDWLAAAHPTIADLAIYSYVTVADEGDYDLEPYAAVRAWLSRVEGLEGYVPMPRRPTG